MAQAGRAALLGPLLYMLASVQQSAGIKLTMRPMNGPMQFQLPAAKTTPPEKPWKYYPPGAKFGIVTGGNLSEFMGFNYGSKAATIMLRYAKRHGYAFYVDRNLLRFGRPKHWGKIQLIQELMEEVPMLVWMDPDVIITKPEVRLETVLNATAHDCRNLNQAVWDGATPQGVTPNTFLWLNAAYSPARFRVNMDTAVMFIKPGAEAKNFLERVWHVGDDPKFFLKFDDPERYRKKDDKADGYGWPYETGAMWDVMQKDMSLFQNACFAKQGTFHSSEHWRWNNGMFANRVAGLPDVVMRKISQEQLETTGHYKPEIM